MISPAVLQWKDLAALQSVAGLSANLILAVIAQESGGDPYAWNPEPRWRFYWDVRNNKPFRSLSQAEIDSKTPPADFSSLAGDRDQEWWAQEASWGLMQPMGAVARECGYRGPYLTRLVEPELNIHIGSTHLSRKIKQAGGDVRHALQLYNGGGNPRYADEVMGKMAEIGR
jgi:hypothetical protein